MKTPLHSRDRSGFSLVEMMTVISIIGIMVAIILPHFGSFNAEANLAKDRRNAQSIVSVYTAGAAAGVAWPTGTVAAKVAAVNSGLQPTSGPFTGTIFRCEATSAEMAANSYRYIGQNADGELVYDHQGGRNANGL